MQFVRNNDNCLPVCTHIAHHGEKLVRLLRCKNRGRLVKNQNIRVAVKNFDYFNRLLLGNRHVIDFLIGIYIKTIPVAYCADFLSRCLHIKLFVKSEDNVFSRG